VAPVPSPHHPAPHVPDGLDRQLHHVEQVRGQGGTHRYQTRKAGREMSLIPSQSSGLSATSRRRYWRAALAGTVTLVAALFAVAPAASAAVAAKPALAATVGTAQISDRSHATQPSGPVSEGRISTISPDISEQSCSGRGTWVHFYVAGGARCFGGTGTIITNFQSDEICAGNNSGSFKYTYAGQRNTQSFFPGFYWAFPHSFTINSVTITGWSGNYQCGGVLAPSMRSRPMTSASR
jgi:hypothetical protein